MNEALRCGLAEKSNRFFVLERHFRLYSIVMITIMPLSESHSTIYDAFVAQHPQANAYHSRAWLKVLHSTYGYQPATLIAQDSQKSIVGILPLMRVQGRLKGRRLVSLPFSHCVPLLTSDEDARHSLLEAAIKLAKEGGDSYIELKTRQPVRHDAFQSSLLNHISELSLEADIETLYKNFSQNNRRNIKKADQADFVLREGRTAEDFETFYQLEVATRHRQGAPIYPADFFRHVAAKMKNDVRLYLLSLDGRDIAGLVIFHSGERAIYAYGGSLRNEVVNRLRPNNWMMWQAIKGAKADGYRIFDFGTTPLHHESLLAFKQHFRPQHSDLPYWYYLNTRQSVPIIQRDSLSVKLAETVLRWMPRRLFTRLSPLLLREVG